MALPHSFGKILLFSLLPVAAMVLGSLIAAFRVPGAAWRSAILHFAAGVVFSVVAVELLPDIIKRHAPLEVAIGFALGVGAMLGLRVLSGGEEKAEAGEATEPAGKTPFPTGLLFGVGVDIFVDGLLLGIGFAAGAKEGTLLALALATELLSLGLATSAALGRAGISRGKNVAVNAALSLSFFVAAMGGATLLSHLSGEWLELVLSFGLAALLFLVTEELLTEAHEEEETPLLTLAFFGGFLLFLLLGMAL